MSSGKKVQSPESWVQSLKFEVRRLMLSSEPGTGNPPQKRPCWCLYYWPVTKMRPSQSVFSSLVDRLTLGCAAKFSSRLFFMVIKFDFKKFHTLHSGRWTLDSNKKRPSWGFFIVCPFDAALVLSVPCSGQLDVARDLRLSKRGLPRANKKPTLNRAGFLCVEWCRRRDFPLRSLELRGTSFRLRMKLRRDKHY